jgi:hypothetical protein
MQVVSGSTFGMISAELPVMRSGTARSQRASFEFGIQASQILYAPHCKHRQPQPNRSRWQLKSVEN